MRNRMSIGRSAKIIRDPVHDVISFRLDRPTDALLFALINAPEFQRLRRIRQLGLANLAYPGADHSRYSHSLGVMQTARRMLEHLGQLIDLNPRDQTRCLAACLLHDLGHGPFSHVFERVGNIQHEQLGARIIRDSESRVHQVLAAHDAALPAEVAGMLRGEAPADLYRDVLSGQLDADRLDYLLRDNLMTGSRYGGFDLTWLLHALTIDSSTGRLAVTAKGISAVEAYLQSRYHMYRNVYFHKVVRSAEGMVRLALQRARRLMVQGRLPWPPRENVVFKALTGQRLSISEFTELDDVSVLYCIKLWSRAEDAPLASLCRGLLDRQLYKTIDLARCGGDAQRLHDATTAATAAVVSAGGDPAYDLFYDQPADTPYEAYDPTLANPAQEILVRDPAGTLTPLATLSPLTQSLNRQLMFRRLHVAPQWANFVEVEIARCG